MAVDGNCGRSRREGLSSTSGRASVKVMRFVCILCAALPCFCQQQPSAIGRPKIGVVLEGGGALGLAHIGVLQWFEDHHIPVDYVAGTSMGGLVGGLYAAG